MMAANVVYCFLPCTSGMLTQLKSDDKVEPRNVPSVAVASARTIPLSKVFQQRPASTSDIVPVLKEAADLAAVMRPVIDDLALTCLKRTSGGCSSQMVEARFRYRMVSEVGQPAQCKWRPLIGQCEITAYVMSAGSSLSSFFILIDFVAFSS
jgi:hypothetical protein